MLKLLLISDKPGEDGSLNTGNAVTNDLKVCCLMIFSLALSTGSWMERSHNANTLTGLGQDEQTGWCACYAYRYI